MDPLRHLANPSYDHREGSGSKIHYEAADGQASLCKQVRPVRVLRAHQDLPRQVRDITLILLETIGWFSLGGLTAALIDWKRWRWW